MFWTNPHQTCWVVRSSYHINRYNIGECLCRPDYPNSPQKRLLPSPVQTNQEERCYVHTLYCPIVNRYPCASTGSRITITQTSIPPHPGKKTYRGSVTVRDEVLLEKQPEKLHMEPTTGERVRAIACLRIRIPVNQVDPYSFKPARLPEFRRGWAAGGSSRLGGRLGPLSRLGSLGSLQLY